MKQLGGQARSPLKSSFFFSLKLYPLTAGGICKWSTGCPRGQERVFFGLFFDDYDSISRTKSKKKEGTTMDISSSRSVDWDPPPVLEDVSCTVHGMIYTTHYGSVHYVYQHTVILLYFGTVRRCTDDEDFGKEHASYLPYQRSDPPVH